MRQKQAHGSGTGGVALPTVLVCLVALAALLSGVLMVASTELLVSHASRDAVEDRYLAEAAIHAWIEERGASLEEGVTEAWFPPGFGIPVRLTVERLASVTPTDANAVFAVDAAPVRGGVAARSTHALIRVRTDVPPPFVPDIDATITASRGVEVESVGSGTAVLDGRDSACQDLDHQASASVLIGVGNGVQLSGSEPLQGPAIVSELVGPRLVEQVLGGQRIRDLAWNADVRFGRYFNEPGFRTTTNVRSGSPDPRYDWGCPAEVLDRLPAGPWAACDETSGEAAWRMVAIDAANDTVRLSSHHGQGMLMIVNGHLHLGGTFAYRGLILAEGAVVLSGGGPGWPPSIEGAVIAGERVVVMDGRDPATAGMTDRRRVVRFDRCAVTLAVQRFGQAGPDRWLSRRVQGRPHAWTELVR